MLRRLRIFFIISTLFSLISSIPFFIGVELFFILFFSFIMGVSALFLIFVIFNVILSSIVYGYVDIISIFNLKDYLKAFKDFKYQLRNPPKVKVGDRIILDERIYLIKEVEFIYHKGHYEYLSENGSAFYDTDNFVKCGENGKALYD